MSNAMVPYFHLAYEQHQRQISHTIKPLHVIIVK